MAMGLIRFNEMLFILFKTISGKQGLKMIDCYNTAFFYNSGTEAPMFVSKKAGYCGSNRIRCFSLTYNEYSQ